MAYTRLEATVQRWHGYESLRQRAVQQERMTRKSMPTGQRHKSYEDSLHRMDTDEGLLEGGGQRSLPGGDSP